ncbi:MAG: nitroreductase family protein [Candidatus Omnitrophica bacterium]|nr:nitroreductase family protein [Candidatus Omnitrophota bacterium]
MESFECFANRVSVREYLDKPVDNGLLEKIIDAGRRAPTARCVEPWEFVVIRNKEVLKKLAELAPNGKFLKDAACCLAIFCQETKYYLEDGCAATENILLAIADLGLGACWVAGDKKPYVDDVAKLVNAPEGLKLVSLISLGWPKQQIKQSKNRSLKEVLHWEKF